MGPLSLTSRARKELTGQLSRPGSGEEAVGGALRRSSVPARSPPSPPSGEEPRFQNHDSLSLSNSPQPDTARRRSHTEGRSGHRKLATTLKGHGRTTLGVQSCHWVCVCLSGFVYLVNPFPSPLPFYPKPFCSRVLGTCSSSVPFASALLGGTPETRVCSPLDWKSPWAGTEALLPGAVLGGKAWSSGFSTAWSANAS